MEGEAMILGQMSEIEILSALLFKSIEFHPYVIKIEPDFFSGNLRDFFSVFQEYYKKYGKAPAESVYKIEFDGSSQAEMLDVFQELNKTFASIKTMEPDYLISKLDLFVKKSFIKKTLLSSYEEYELGNYDKIIHNFNRLNEAVIDNNMGSNYFDPDFFAKKYAGSSSGLRIKTGSRQFDETFFGLHRKSLTIFAGPSNAGKTMCLVNIVGHLLELKDEIKNILYITLEIDEESIGRRVDANILGVPVNEMRARINDKNEGDALAGKFIQIRENQNRLVIKAMRGGSTPSDIESLIRNLSVIPLKGEVNVFKPDVVMVDYLGLLKPNHFNKNMNSYERGKEISEELRQLSQDFNLAIVAAAQTNRSSFGNDVGQESVSDSIAIAQTADLFLTINRNDELDRVNQLMIYLAKSRFSKNNIKFLFGVDFDCMRMDDVDTGRVDCSEENI